MDKSSDSRKRSGGEQDAPDVEVNDEVYFRHKDGRHLVGRVRSRGAHGCHVDSDGVRHKMRWDGFLGHKTKVKANVKVVDQGEDGIMVEDQQGKRRFVHDPMTPETPMRKSVPVLFFGEEEVLQKALSVKNRPGLALRDITDKSGRHSKHWVKTGKDAPKQNHGGHDEPAHAPRYGHGDRVSFSVGGLKGHGEVVGRPGAHGAHVRDESGHVHKVLWDAIGDAGEKPAAEPAGGEKQPAEPKGLFSQDTASLPSRAAQPVKSWEELREKGEEGLGQFKAALNKVADQLGLRTDMSPKQLEGDHVTSDEGFLFIGKLKGEERARQKVDAEYGGDWSQVRDVIRATIAVSSMDQVREAVKAVEAAGLELAQKPKDKFTNPTPEGYRDLNTIVKLPNGMLAELQYHLKPITEAKNSAHKDYEESRTLSAKYGEDAPTGKWSDEDHARFHQAVKRQKDTYGAAWKRAGGEQMAA